MMWVVSVWCVVMVVCVSPGCRSQQAVTPALLQTIMPQILNTYGRIQGQYSLAISIPWDPATGQYQIQRVFDTDTSGQVITRLNGGGVYSGTYVVAAKVLARAGRGDQHSEFRVLAEAHRKARTNQMVNSVQSLQGRNLLVFYTVNSPCWTTCTVARHNEGILQRITIMSGWDQYAVVFTQAFQPRGTENQTPAQKQIDEGHRRGALTSLAGSLTGGGLQGINYIYRCLRGECFRCGNNQNHVVRRCVTLDGAEVIRPPPRGGVDEEGWITAGH